MNSTVDERVQEYRNGTFLLATYRETGIGFPRQEIWDHLAKTSSWGSDWQKGMDPRKHVRDILEWREELMKFWNRMAQLVS
jgi:hypothetical protein